MKTSKSILVCVGVLFFNVYCVFGQPAESQQILWGRDANSIVLSKDRLTKLGDVFPSWKVKQVTWPSEKEIDSNSVMVGEGLKQSCIGWLKKFIKEDQLPANLQGHLIAMEGWGLIQEQTEQKRLCDVFITRFKKDNHVIHIQESPSNVVIAVADERIAKEARTDHKNLVIETGTLVLNETLKPNANSKDLHVFEIVRDERKISRVSWVLESVSMTDKDGRECIDIPKAVEIGAAHVKAETNGSFVKFDISKAVKGSRLHPYPYIERFNPPPPQDLPAKKRKNPEAEGEMFKPSGNEKK